MKNQQRLAELIAEIAKEYGLECISLRRSLTTFIRLFLSNHFGLCIEFRGELSGRLLEFSGRSFQGYFGYHLYGQEDISSRLHVMYLQKRSKGEGFKQPIAFRGGGLLWCW